MMHKNGPWQQQLNYLHRVAISHVIERRVQPLTNLHKTTGSFGSRHFIKYLTLHAAGSRAPQQTLREASLFTGWGGGS